MGMREWEVCSVALNGDPPKGHKLYEVRGEIWDRRKSKGIISSKIMDRLWGSMDVTGGGKRE